LILMVMDRILIKDAPFLCSIGIKEEERVKKQEILIDVELFTHIKGAAETDRIEDTVDYTEVYQLIGKEVEKGHFNLIETLAEKIAQMVLRNFNIERVSVKVKKPTALSHKGVRYTGVEIKRSR
jgi:dihydroneopterin aldolase